MKLLDRIFGIDKKVEEKLSAAVDERVKTILPQPVAERLQAASISLDREYGWRLLNGQNTRQLMLAPYDEQILTAYWLYKTNPLAAFIIDTPAAFIAADKLPFEAANEQIQTLLQAWWDRNRLELRWGDYMKEAGVFANLVLTANVAEQTGRVKLGYIDPGLIITTIPDPEDVQTKIGVQIRASELYDTQRTFKVILDRDTEEDLSPAAKRLRDQMTDGQCFLLQVNCMSSELLGTSELFNVSEHLDAFEQTMLDNGEKNAMYNAFYYDITVTGADNKQLAEERELYTPPKTGGAFIHNEKVKSEPVTPDLKPLDAEVATRTQRRHIMGAKGLPNHWYADPEGSNRATASEMDRPTIKRLERRQNEAAAWLRTMADFVVTSALEASYITVPEEEAYQYEMSKPPLTDKDVAKLSALLRDVSTSLVVAEGQGWIDKGKAGKMFAFCTAMLGFEYDPDDSTELPPEGQDYKTAKFAPETPNATPAPPTPGSQTRSGP